METKGSFIGFTFGNRHSSELGIFRTSSSNRYETNLVPPTMDITTEVPGSDGLHLWSSSFAKREIPISFAFFGLTEEQYRSLKKVFSTKELTSLILDEEPYKVWTVKPTSFASTKMLCFESMGHRFYCGNGEIIFTAYFPFARSRYQYIEDYDSFNLPEWREEITNDRYTSLIIHNVQDYEWPADIEHSMIEWLQEVQPLASSDFDIEDIASYADIFQIQASYGNLEEWKTASKIPSRDNYGAFGDTYKLYNAGDLPIPIKAYIKLIDGVNNYFIRLDDKHYIYLSEVYKKTEEEYLLVDSFQCMVWGCDYNFNRTKNIYNANIVDGNFFDIPLGENNLTLSSYAKIDFNYLYL